MGIFNSFHDIPAPKTTRALPSSLKDLPFAARLEGLAQASAELYGFRVASLWLNLRCVNWEYHGSQSSFESRPVSEDTSKSLST